ncbi:formimidoylglutamase [Apibacter sp. HY039]|uniref:formimidoylglutamase n=1 Tax=Apibacter sp. HY039 TaxID=2501476 RepID=UPI000FEB94F7|nr:formimidoylglutamase [Apibacter sp. HY039]
MGALQDFLHPVDESILYSHPDSVGARIKFYWQNEIKANSVVLIGCSDLRGTGHSKEFSNIRLIREEFYRLVWNDWDFDLYDLGDIIPGNEVENTYFALQKVLEELLKMGVFPIVLGGSMSLNYSVYRALSVRDTPLNYTAVDTRIDMGNMKEQLTDKNYLSRMIIDEPNLLFNFTNVGYQSYFVPNSTLKAFNSLDFEGVRLGQITENPKNSEPVFRSSDFVGINLNSIESYDGTLSTESTANGFTNREICALTRYIGLSKQVKIAGIYNFLGYSHNKMNEKLVSQLLWYLIEGRNQQPYYENEEYIKYIVLHEDKELIFLKDKYVEKWWLTVSLDADDVPVFLVPCTKKDYEDALNGNIPEKYWKTFKRFL